MNRLFPLTALLITFFIVGCSSNPPRSTTEKQQAIVAMKDDVLTELFKIKPDVREQILKAPGYGVFSNANAKFFLASVGGGHGVVQEKATGKYTYMRMGEVGLGLGLGLKDVRIVFVFHNESSLKRFIESGWTFSAQADAAAKAGDKGAAVAGEAIVDNITIYQLTKAGLALQATLKGTRYWKNEELN